MKFTIQALKKNSYVNNEIDEVIDFSYKIDEEILDVDPCHVYGHYTLANNDTEYIFDLNINVNLYMACAITLEKVKVPLKFDVSLLFTDSRINDDVYLIDGQTINLDEAIWANILVEKPMIVKKEDVEFDEPQVEIEEEDINPFKALKKLGGK